tara:strand:+ start:4387 stop:4566 length:180 start_codon:yes stop_codon:yes gene_type:complete
MGKLGNILHELKIEHNKQKKRGNKMTKQYRKKTLYITRTITLIMVTITVLRMMQIEGWF